MTRFDPKNAKYWLRKLAYYADVPVKISFIKLRNEFKRGKLNSEFKQLMRLTDLAFENEKLAVDNGAPMELVFDAQVRAAINVQSALDMLLDQLSVLNPYWLTKDGQCELTARVAGGNI